MIADKKLIIIFSIIIIILLVLAGILLYNNGSLYGFGIIPVNYLIPGVPYNGIQIFISGKLIFRQLPRQWIF